MRTVACLNGNRRPGAHPALPISPDQIVADARAAVDAGATCVHVHPRDGHAEQALEPQVLTPVLRELRAAIPGAMISVTTSLAAQPDAWRRFDLVGRWAALPDSATVNLSEPGGIEVARLLHDRRVPIEAVVTSVMGARLLAVTGIEVERIAVAPTEADVGKARSTVAQIDAVLDRRLPEPPRTLHGRDQTAWPLLDDAIAAGHDIRIGLEDTLFGPDGNEAHDNAELVRAAVERTAARRVPADSNSG
ncbi:3-keto-5-aminohexanoate cleavage protein [Spiractinospora alimapuensis]|uniref:3-keto-5-aminohexanoate cleavage protein n=1 Tax=Spiractinospora alimapuensis TaxID=2820884 RepID=UPI001F42A3C4|nr:3-keto-5-aminohexanoate cleavage protein [Spiractinospora alimapuensis]QVQ50660.1 3-keto-5-aminohexanoate cleavage protein [Spiractinospora alimapuensis]